MPGCRGSTSTAGRSSAPESPGRRRDHHRPAHPDPPMLAPPHNRLPRRGRCRLPPLTGPRTTGPRSPPSPQSARSRPARARELALIEAARDAGATWTRIAAALGARNRQTAQKRHADLARRCLRQPSVDTPTVHPGHGPGGTSQRRRWWRGCSSESMRPSAVSGRRRSAPPAALPRSALLPVRSPGVSVRLLSLGTRGTRRPTVSFHEKTAIEPPAIPLRWPHSGTWRPGGRTGLERRLDGGGLLQLDHPGARTRVQDDHGALNLLPTDR